VSTQVIAAIIVGGLFFVTIGFKLLMMLWVSLRGDTRKPGGLVLRATLGKARPETPDFHSAPSEWARYLGVSGIAETDLRPAGKARLGDNVVDVVSLQAWIERGERVVVVEVEGVRVVVDRPSRTS
jgi:membrane-bound serine protease (ClpP class)